MTEFSKGLTPGCRPLSPVVRNGDIWFSEYEAGQIGRITMDGHVTEYPIPTPNSEPRAMVTHPDGHIWFVETKANALGRIDAQGRVTEWPVKTPDASLRGVTVAPDGDLWFTENFANKIGRMAPDGTRNRRICDPGRELRRTRHHRDPGRAAVLLGARRRRDRRSDPAVK